MPHVVTAACFGCRYTDCVTVCPCDCFREGEQMLYIDPESCIDCSACQSECPTSAIYYHDDVPADLRDFISLNAEMAAKCPPITTKLTPLKS
ncbi:MAG: 4Fe-4S binding protein [Pirellulales bacterium]